MKLLYYLSIALTIAANVFYHFFQKLIAPKANPLFSLMITYCTATLISFFYGRFFRMGII